MLKVVRGKNLRRAFLAEGRRQGRRAAQLTTGPSGGGNASRRRSPPTSTGPSAQHWRGSCSGRAVTRSARSSPPKPCGPKRSGFAARSTPPCRTSSSATPTRAWPTPPAGATSTSPAGSTALVGDRPVKELNQSGSHGGGRCPRPSRRRMTGPDRTLATVRTPLSLGPSVLRELMTSRSHCRIGALARSSLGASSGRSAHWRPSACGRRLCRPAQAGTTNPPRGPGASVPHAKQVLPPTSEGYGVRLPLARKLPVDETLVGLRRRQGDR
jgi:hypothetical protein